MSKSAFVRLSLLCAVVIVGLDASLSATHAWGGYHWARTGNPFNLQGGSNLTTAAWRTALGSENAAGSAISDWNLASGVLDLTLVAGRAKGNCKPTVGRIEVCNGTYGNNGWLGIAQIWITGGVHITQATTKLNDTYFNTPTYNTAAWRQLVTCQEVGHNFGLGHQDENFYNLNKNTCMDYTNDPESNQHPNAHDYEQLNLIYLFHTDSFSTAAAAKLPNGVPPAMGQLDFDGRSQWGQVKKESRRESEFELDFGGGNLLVTHVFWADPENDAHAH